MTKDTEYANRLRARSEAGDPFTPRAIQDVAWIYRAIKAGAGKDLRASPEALATLTAAVVHRLKES